MRRIAAIVALAVVVPWAPARAASVLAGYAVAAQASGLQWTYDFPQAPFHPLAESEYGYSKTTIDPTKAEGVAATFWPGSAGGNFGSLLGVLGGPTVTALNDPARAQAATGSQPTHQTLGSAPGPVMDASVDPEHPGDQQATARSASSSGDLGAVAHLGSATTTSSSVLDPSTGVLTTSATSALTNVSIGGVVTVASVESRAQGTSAGGAKPAVNGSAQFHDMRIAGQPVSVDASGIHVGKAGSPGAAEQIGVVDQALANAGMAVYFTTPETIVVGEVSYYYAASVLVFWQPPHDSNGDSFSVSLGGAAVAMSVNAGDAVGQPTLDGAAPPASVPPMVIPPSPATPQLALPAPASTAAVPVTAVASRTIAGAPASVALSRPAVSSGGVTAAWILLALVAGLAGATLLPRLPGLLTAAADPVCPREQPPAEGE